MQVVERWILMRLRHQRFASVDDLNEAIAPLPVQASNWGKFNRPIGGADKNLDWLCGKAQAPPMLGGTTEAQ